MACQIPVVGLGMLGPPARLFSSSREAHKATLFRYSSIYDSTLLFLISSLSNVTLYNTPRILSLLPPSLGVAKQGLVYGRFAAFEEENKRNHIL